MIFDTDASESTLKRILKNDFSIRISDKEYKFTIWGGRSGWRHSTFLGNLPRTKNDMWFVAYKDGQVWCSKQFSAVVATLLKNQKIEYKLKKRIYLNKDNSLKALLRWLKSKQ